MRRGTTDSATPRRDVHKRARRSTGSGGDEGVGGLHLTHTKEDPLRGQENQPRKNNKDPRQPTFGIRNWRIEPRAAGTPRPRQCGHSSARPQEASTQIPVTTSTKGTIGSPRTQRARFDTTPELKSETRISPRRPASRAPSPYGTHTEETPGTTQPGDKDSGEPGGRYGTTTEKAWALLDTYCIA